MARTRSHARSLPRKAASLDDDSSLRDSKSNRSNICLEKVSDLRDSEDDDLEEPLFEKGDDDDRKPAAGAAGKGRMRGKKRRSLSRPKKKMTRQKRKCSPPVQAKSYATQSPPPSPGDRGHCANRLTTLQVLRTQKLYTQLDVMDVPKSPVPDDELDKQIYERTGFCCYHCCCPEERKQHYVRDFNNDTYIESGITWHRCCCHAVTDEYLTDPNKMKDWKTLFERTCLPTDLLVDEASGQQRYEFAASRGEEQNIVFDWDGLKAEFDKTELDQLRWAKDDLPSPGNHFQGYDSSGAALQQMKDQIPYQKLKQKPPCAVLDLSDGVGAEIVALKRLGIDLAKVVRWNADKVTTYVYRTNHDHQYNPELEEAGEKVEHVFYQSFKQPEQRELDDIVTKHGPFDLLLASPLHKRNDLGDIGSKLDHYLVRLCSMIKNVRKHEKQRSRHLFFLAEVGDCGTDSAEWGSALLDSCETVFRIQPISFNAKYLSPSDRQHYFLTNIPLDPGQIDLFCKKADVAGMNPDICLETGYKAPWSWLSEQALEENVDQSGPASSRFVVLPTHRNNNATLVFRKEEQSGGKAVFYGRHLTVSEREATMGLPCGYVRCAVKELFGAVFNEGFFKSTYDWNWKKRMEKRHQVFAGNYHGFLHGEFFRFDTSFQPFRIKLAPPPTSGAVPTFFDWEQYSNYLMGNSSCVVVLEALVKPLQAIYARRKYQSHSNKYKWDGFHAKQAQPPLTKAARSACALREEDDKVSGSPASLRFEDPGNQKLGHASDDHDEPQNGVRSPGTLATETNNSYPRSADDSENSADDPEDPAFAELVSHDINEGPTFAAPAIEDHNSVPLAPDKKKHIKTMALPTHHGKKEVDCTRPVHLCKIKEETKGEELKLTPLLFPASRELEEDSDNQTRGNARDDKDEPREELEDGVPRTPAHEATPRKAPSANGSEDQTHVLLSHDIMEGPAFPPATGDDESTSLAPDKKEPIKAPDLPTLHGKEEAHDSRPANIHVRKKSTKEEELKQAPLLLPTSSTIKEEEMSTHHDNDRGNKLWVSGLSKQVDLAHLRSLFAVYGKVIALEACEPGFCMVTMDSHEAAVVAKFELGRSYFGPDRLNIQCIP